MRVRTREDVELLESQILNRLDIDVKKYRNEEVIENLTDLLVFPTYVLNWVIRPILIFILIYFIGYFVLDLVHVEYIIYAIVGLGLFVISGLFLGLIILLNRMRSDIWGIVDYSIGIMKEAVRDLKHANNNITDENRSESLGLLFKGIIHIVTLPLLSKVISEKISFVGWIVNGLVKRVLISASDKIEFDKLPLKREEESGEDSTLEGENNEEIISSDADGLEKILKVAFNIAKFPLMLIFIGTFLLLILFIYLIN